MRSVSSVWSAWRPSPQVGAFLKALILPMWATESVCKLWEYNTNNHLNKVELDIQNVSDLLDLVCRSEWGCPQVFLLHIVSKHCCHYSQAIFWARGWNCNAWILSTQFRRGFYARSSHIYNIIIAFALKMLLFEQKRSLPAPARY